MAVDPDERVFDTDWERRAFAMALLSMRLSGTNLDAFRHALERQAPREYFTEGYYGRWLAAAETLLTDSQILASGAVEARARKLAGEDIAEPETPEPAKPDYAPTAAGSLRQVEAQPAFAVGDRVRTKPHMGAHHTRLPRYARGRVGEVVELEPAALLPDTHAHFQGENAQHVYTVRFASHELWGPDAEDFHLSIELFETYLEPA